MRERRRVRQVVDRDPLDLLRSLCPASHGGAEHVPADPAESVDPNANGHSLPPEAKMNDAGYQECGSFTRRTGERLSAGSLRGHASRRRGRLVTASTTAYSDRYERSSDTATPSSRAPRALVDVAVGDRHVEVVVVPIALREVLGDRHRAVAPAGATDRDHQVRLTLGDILRQQEVEQRMQAHMLLLQAPIAGDVLDNTLVLTRQLAQIRLIVGVREEAHIERHVLLAWRARLAAE